MKHEEILKKSIDKAIKNGWKYEHDGRATDSLIEWIYNNDERYESLMESISVETIIFSHDFTKAFWKPMNSDEEFNQKELGMDWKYHLQQMVLEEDHVEYLERFL